MSELSIGLDAFAGTAIAKSFLGYEDIEKGGKALPVGTRKLYGKQWFIKTANGWRPEAKGRNKHEELEGEERKRGDQEPQSRSKKEDSGAPDKAKLDEISNDASLSRSDKVRALLNEGVAKKDIAKHLDMHYSQVHGIAQKHTVGDNPKQEKKQREASGAQGGSKKEKAPEKDKYEGDDLLSAPERFKEYEGMVQRLIKGRLKSVVAFGEGGIGKTYRATKMFDAAGMQQGVDYVTFTGGTTPQGLFQTLYDNQDKLIVFDDYDDVLKNQDSINYLKAALDSSGNNKITSGKKQPADSPYPSSFNFKGRVLFISNMNMEDEAKKSPHMGAILSRADAIDLKMTKKETLEVIKDDILPVLDFKKADGTVRGASLKDKQEVFDFLDKNQDEITELSVRTMGKIYAIKKEAEKRGKDWQKEALAMLVPGKQDTMTVDERFDALEDCAEIVAKGDIKSMIIYGEGGIGKTYSTTDRLQKVGMVDSDTLTEDVNDDGESVMVDDDGNEVPMDKQFVSFTGRMTARGLYEALYNNNGRLILLDDIDSVLKDKKAVNVLKGALDTSGSGQINWTTAKKKKEGGEEGEDGEPMEGNDDIPEQFDFKGRVIFISNMNESELAQPLRSRALTVNASMSPDQAIQRFRTIANRREQGGGSASSRVPEATHKDLRDVIDFLDENQKYIGDRHFNARTLDKLIATKVSADEEGRDWKRIAKTKLFAKAIEDNLLSLGIAFASLKSIEKSLRSFELN